MIQKPKGTYDVFKERGSVWLYLIKLLNELSDKYNYRYLRTPIFEHSEVFKRGVGVSTDIVNKEMYDFKDKGDRSLTLRPEGTAGVVRCFVENKFYSEETIPTKVFYYGPMFRYERPQTGRNREFYQWGLEAFGSRDAAIDAEIVSFAYNFFKMIGLDVEVNINSIGDKESRAKYREVLVSYFMEHESDLCEDCKKRLETNPLRILDCKIDNKSEIFASAPRVTDFLSSDSKKYYEEFKSALKALKIPFEENPKLVRGLDYYSETVFEFVGKAEELGAQNVVAGGGRYDYLVEMLDGPSTPGVGFSLGLDRVIEVLTLTNNLPEIDESIDTYVVVVDEMARGYALELCQMLRVNGFSSDIDYLKKSVKGQLKQVSKYNPSYVIFVGEKEVKADNVQIKNNETFEEELVSKEDLINYLDERL